MKKSLFIFALTCWCITSHAQKIPFNVVIDVTSQDTVVHHMVMRWVKEIAKAYPDAKVEVVFYAQSLDMITKNKSVVAEDVINMTKNKNIAFSACEVAMKSNEVEKSQLLPGVGTVEAGIYEIVKRQYEGWGYIKAAR
jgi:hypothetical protein